MWIGFVWLRIGSRDGLLWTQDALRFQAGCQEDLRSFDMQQQVWSVMGLPASLFRITADNGVEKFGPFCAQHLEILMRGGWHPGDVCRSLSASRFKFHSLPPQLATGCRPQAKHTRASVCTQRGLGSYAPGVRDLLKIPLTSRPIQIHQSPNHPALCNLRVYTDSAAK